ncbi:hypothetical protein TIFTF001_031696 [Ficus carica]|uniref:Uncharacterized protein n=1 Tax=Ficus carica TaxID=3494 RepID=A0AA88DVR3_FICCA|nr:hypothetical protein TIFTF001_031696 [Ficus carica]
MVSEREFPTIQFHSSAASATVFCTKEDIKASLAFRGMEEELRIFDRTQRVVLRNEEPFQIM